jgi:HD-GYP domain-containing protein (c-di-GMP phosphodiesterase class II)
LVEDRIYRPALPHDVALNIIKEERGQLFDPVLADIFCANHELFRRSR